MNIEDFIPTPSRDIPTSDTSDTNDSSELEEEKVIFSPADLGPKSREDSIATGKLAKQRVKQPNPLHSKYDYQYAETRTMRKRRNRIPFLKEEKKYILNRYYILTRSSKVKVKIVADIIYNELYLNPDVVDNQQILSIRDQLGFSSFPCKKNRSKKSVLNLLYNERKHSRF